MVFQKSQYIGIQTMVLQIPQYTGIQWFFRYPSIQGYNGSPDTLVYRDTMVLQIPQYTGIQWFSRYPSIQEYNGSPDTLVYRNTMVLQIPQYTGIQRQILFKLQISILLSFFFVFLQQVCINKNINIFNLIKIFPKIFDQIVITC